MNLPLYIAKRYILSKKSTNAINIISAISAIGVAVATMALVVVLSVFNGFHDMVASFFTNFDPQLEVVPVMGKTIAADNPKLTEIKNFKEVDIATECVEDMALAIFNDRQAMIYIKGVEDNFAEQTHITEILYGDGHFTLHAGNLQYGIPGIRLAAALGTGACWPGFMKIYAPEREGQFDINNPEEGFTVDSLISPGVIFAVNQAKYDKNTMLTHISFARSLFGLQGEITSLQLRMKPGVDISAVKRRMQEVAGSELKVMDRYEQQADTFRIMQIEKIIAYAFLCFILIIACFNIIGSISMLIIEKKSDVQTLRNLGASDKLIARIFMLEGRMIALIGAITGVALGLLLCLLQQQYGFVKMGSNSASYIVSSYPVSVHYTDVLIVFLTVIIVGWTAVWYPVHYMSKRLLS